MHWYNDFTPRQSVVDNYNYSKEALAFHFTYRHRDCYVAPHDGLCRIYENGAWYHIAAKVLPEDVRNAAALWAMSNFRAIPTVHEFLSVMFNGDILHDAP